MSPERGLWVGTRHGEYAGMVERRDGAYLVRSARGRDLGSFGDLASACDAVDGVAADITTRWRRLTTLLWIVNGVAAVVALGLTFALVR